jgi:hypothetical protein
VISAGGVVVEV